MIANVSGITRVKANLLQTDPYYSGTNDTGTNVTMMLTDGGHHNWAQWGWFKSKIDGHISIKLETGLEFWLNDGQTNIFHFWPSRPIGESTTYEIRQITSGFEYHMNGSLMYSTGPKFTTTQYQMFGETHDYWDQMPGGTTTHETIRNAKYYSGGAWHTSTSNIDTDWIIYGYSNPSDGNYDLWDKACTT